MAKGTPSNSDEETPEERQRREAEEVARGRAGSRTTPQSQLLEIPPFRQPTTRPAFHPRSQHSDIIPPPPQFSDGFRPEMFHDIHRPQQRRRHSESDVDMQRPSGVPEVSGRRRHTAGDMDTQRPSGVPGRRRHTAGSYDLMRSPDPLMKPLISQPETIRPSRRIQAANSYDTIRLPDPSMQPLTSQPEPIPPSRTLITRPPPGAPHRFSDPVSGEPDWDRMRTAIEDENRDGLSFGTAPIRQPTARYDRISIPAKLYGQRLSAKTKAETIAIREHGSQRPLRKVHRLGESGYTPVTQGAPITRPDLFRWVSTTPRLDPNQRRVLSPQSGGFPLRRTYSEPVMSDWELQNFVPERQLDSEETKLAKSLAARQEWTNPMRKRTVFHKSHYQQNEKDISRVRALMRERNFDMLHRLDRDERRRHVSDNAKVDTVIEVEELSIEIYPIPEGNEDQEEDEEEESSSSSSSRASRVSQDFGDMDDWKKDLDDDDDNDDNGTDLTGID